MNRKILKFRIGEESIPVITTDQERTESPFGNAILRALDCIENKIISSNNIFTENDAQAAASTADSWEANSRNNIVTFLGDRGTGKTSCMRSVVSICRTRQSDWLFTNEIDPSFFDKKHNILEILIGELYGMFKGFQNDWYQQNRKQQERLREIENCFRKVKEALRYMDSDIKVDDNDSETDGLRLLNEGGKLRGLIKDLISKMLSYKGCKYLIISIDDLDLNIVHSYIMMEYIRKYLVLPHVVILVAARYQQLFNSICLELTKYYKVLENRISEKEISGMAERYLNKIFPLDQRIYMPSPESVLECELQIEDKGRKVYDSEEHLTVADRIPALIFEKTRYLFYNSSGMPSLVIPRNLRDVRMLFSMLYAMEPYSDDESTGRQNQLRFRSYFFQEWLGRFSGEYRHFAEALLGEEDMAKINKMVITGLFKFFIEKKLSYESLAKGGLPTDSGANSTERRLLYDILNPGNSYWNVSVGDVVFVINYIHTHFDSDNVRQLLFFIESFYSITLYGLYNEMTGSIVANRLPSAANESIYSSPELKTSVHGEWPAFFRFTGGSFFSLTGDSFIPVAASDKFQREQRLIDGQVLMQEIKAVVKEYKNLKNMSEEEREELSARLRLCEFFMLTVKERVNLKLSDLNPRLESNPLYFYKFGNSVKNLRFDATAPFFNAIYPKFCYDRFNTEIFEIAESEQDSLLNRMIRHNSRSKGSDVWEIMSKSTIRNMEILKDLTAWLKSRRGTLRPDNKNTVGILSDFYKQLEGADNPDCMPIGSYCVKTYVRTKSGGANDHGYYVIDYSIFSLLHQVLEELNSKDSSHLSNARVDKRRKLFENIMTSGLLFADNDSYDRQDVMESLSQYCKKNDISAYFGNENRDTVSIAGLADILASIKLDLKLDFSNVLPEILCSEYEASLSRKYEERDSKLEKEVKFIETRIKDLNRQKDFLNTELAALKKERTSNQNEIKKAVREKNKWYGEITKFTKQLGDLENQNLFEKDSPDRLPIEKEIKKLQIKLDEAHGKMAEAEENIRALEAAKIKNEEDIKQTNERISKIEFDISGFDFQKSEIAKSRNVLGLNFNFKSA